MVLLAVNRPACTPERLPLLLRTAGCHCSVLLLTRSTCESASQACCLGNETCIAQDRLGCPASGAQGGHLCQPRVAAGLGQRYAAELSRRWPPGLHVLWRVFQLRQRRCRCFHPCACSGPAAACCCCAALHHARAAGEQRQTQLAHSHKKPACRERAGTESNGGGRPHAAVHVTQQHH